VLDKGQQDDWFSNNTILDLGHRVGVALTALVIQTAGVEGPDRGPAAVSRTAAKPSASS
jgi:hypothetical protein